MPTQGEPPRSHTIGGIVPVLQGQPPFCAAAVGLMAAARRGPVPALRALVATLPVSAAGIPFLELTEALQPLGLNGLVATLDGVLLRRLLAADVPVLLAVREGNGRHAVLATGYDPGGWTVYDPRLPTPVRWTEADLQSRWQPSQAVVWLPAAHPPPHLPLAWLATQDRRYRALEWALRAEAVGTPGPEMRTLYDRAVQAAPEVLPVRFNRAQLLMKLGQTAEGCAELRRLAAGGIAELAGPAATAARCP